MVRKLWFHLTEICIVVILAGMLLACHKPAFQAPGDFLPTLAALRRRLWFHYNEYLDFTFLLAYTHISVSAVQSCFPE